MHGRSNIYGERSYTVDTLRPVAGNIFPQHQQYPVEAPPPPARSSFSAMMTGLTGAFLAVVIGAAAIMNAGEPKADHAAAAGAQAPAMIAAPVAPVAVAPVAAAPVAAAATPAVATPTAATPADPTDEPGTATGTRKIKKQRRIKAAASAPLVSTATPATTTRPAAPAPAANAADNKEATDTLMRALAERPL